MTRDGGVTPVREIADYDDSDAAIASSKKAAPPPPKTPGGIVWRPSPDRALALGNYGPRLPTQIATLNKATRGGFRLGRLIVLGGAPGAGKTSLAVYFIYWLLLAGFYVAILASDEDADGLLIRLGQLVGCDRDELEAEGPTAAKCELADWLRDFGDRFLLVDADDGANEVLILVEQVAAELKRRRDADPAAKGSVLLVDSIQTAEVTGVVEADGPRLRTDAVIKALRRASKRDRHLVFATSEVNRGNYRSANPAERVSDLASFKESGGIEFKADVALVLRSVAGFSDLVDVTIPKNRLKGADAPTAFRLELNRARASFKEVPLPTDEEQAEQSDRQDTAMHDAILDVVKKTASPLMSANAIYARLKGRSPKASRPIWLKLIKAMDAAGEIVLEGKGRHKRYSVATGTSTGTVPDGDNWYRGNPPIGGVPVPVSTVSNGEEKAAGTSSPATVAAPKNGGGNAN